jgi:hypothetical protein
MYLVRKKNLNTQWKFNLDKILPTTPQQHKAQKAYSALWEWMVKAEYKGACHDSSAILYMLLQEIGFQCDICTGEVKLSTGAVTDHSWVESDGNVFDIAISLPNNPNHFHAPIFNGVSLEGKGLVNAEFGLHYEGLDEEAKLILGQTLSEYLSMHPWGEDFAYKKVKEIAKSIGLRVNVNKLKARYGLVMRSHIERNNISEE